MNDASVKRQLAIAEKFHRSPRKPGQWQPGNNGAGKRRWFLVRHDPENYARILEYYCDKNGKLIRYTMGGAYRKALELQELER